MHASKWPLQLGAVFAALACLGLWGCGGTVASKHDASANGGAGGAAGSGGASSTPSGGSRVDAAIGTGGAGGGGGGTSVSDVPIASGGIAQTGGWPGTGGSYVDGGAPGTGGKAGTGGSTATSPADAGRDRAGGASGTGGGTGTDGGAAVDVAPRTFCGGMLGAQCPTGEFCDIQDHCGMISDSGGHCVLAGPDLGCGGVRQPVCGCDGKTYGNDCERGAAMVQKFSDGPCAPGRDAGADTDRNAGLAWQAAPIDGGAGPGIIVMGQGFYAAGTDTTYRIASELLYDESPSGSLTNAQLDDLFARVMALELAALPHATSGLPTCKAQLMWSTCMTCTRKTLTYSSAAQLAPEMEPVWTWFDQVLGSATVATNPRTYCRP